MAIAIVTGGTGGLGRVICSSMAQSGYQVIALDRTPFLQESPCEFRAINITDPQDVAAVLGEISKTFGVPDVVVNCAGITRDRVSWKMSLEEWQAVLDVNLTGAFNVVRYLAPAFKERKSGVILNISSINATRGKFGQSNYTAAKAGLEALTRNWAIELGAFGVRSNAIAPGMVETEMTQSLPPEVLERAAKERALPWGTTAQDIANAVLFLASDLSKSITGQTIRVDSGQLIG